jgi:hypothetical protein
VFNSSGTYSSTFLCHPPAGHSDGRKAKLRVLYALGTIQALSRFASPQRDKALETYFFQEVFKR